MLRARPHFLQGAQYAKFVHGVSPGLSMRLNLVRTCSKHSSFSQRERESEREKARERERGKEKRRDKERGRKRKRE